MRTIGFEHINVNGELMERAEQNFNRLECKEYRPGNVFMKGYSWPGDFEGRTILALVLSAQATHREPVYLNEIIDRLPLHLNEKGYFGDILPEGFVDEQQLSGHSWLLRGLIEYYLWKKDETILAVIKDIVKNLLLKARGYYSKYPVNPGDRVCEGGAIGNLGSRAVGNWYLSTDVGCAFIMLDGATHAYQLTKDPALKELIDEMIEKFLSTDIYGLSFQTHATLSACRGILRYYETTGDTKLLDAVENIFQLYMKSGMTENYENYNWFNRPEWTEPCAVIDSFILAFGLWKNTGKLAYLETAHNIFYNGICYNQRPNGGFGCDICSGAHDEFLSPKADLYEAYWCCTMRGGEGLSRAIEFGYLTSGDTIIIPFYNNSTAGFVFDDGQITLRQETSYPVKGHVRLTVINSDVESAKTIKLFAPSWTDKCSIKVYVNGNEIPFDALEEGFVGIKTDLRTGTVIELYFLICIRIEPTINENSIKGFHTLRHGALLLGLENREQAIEAGKDIGDFEDLGDARYKIRNTEHVLAPISGNLKTSCKSLPDSRLQILFRG